MEYKRYHIFSRFVYIICVAILCLSCVKEAKTEKPPTIGKSLVVLSDQNTQEMYTYYLQIKNALVEAQPEKVQVAAKALESIIPESESTKNFRATTKLVYLTKELNKQRDFFVTITTEMEKAIQRTTITSGAIYKQFCPMALEGNGGYWLSDNETIQNPFFGEKMLSCGRIEKVLQ